MLLEVCGVDDAIEGELRQVSVDGLADPVMITRVGGSIVVTSAICPHEVVCLADGDVERGVVTCPGHAYQFDLRTGACAHDPALHLRTFRVVVKRDRVWIDLMRPT